MAAPGEGVDGDVDPDHQEAEGELDRCVLLRTDALHRGREPLHGGDARAVGQDRGGAELVADRCPSLRGARQGIELSNKLYVGNLPFTTTEAEVPGIELHLVGPHQVHQVLAFDADPVTASQLRELLSADVLAVDEDLRFGLCRDARSPVQNIQAGLPRCAQRL